MIKTLLMALLAGFVLATPAARSADGMDPALREKARRAVDAGLHYLRAQQAATRDGLPLREYDAGNGLEKFNPLAGWTEKEVWTYIRQNAVPYNALHDKFYPSIGCAPCTRAISPGEDIRAGRWWWESPESKECGLHVKD